VQQFLTQVPYASLKAQRKHSLVIYVSHRWLLPKATNPHPDRPTADKHALICEGARRLVASLPNRGSISHGSSSSNLGASSASTAAAATAAATAANTAANAGGSGGAGGEPAALLRQGVQAYLWIDYTCIDQVHSTALRNQLL
jgi:hypothetical protein